MATTEREALIAALPRALMDAARRDALTDADRFAIGQAIVVVQDAQRAALAAPPVEQQAARATVYIQRDHLEKAKRAPFLCRVEPTQRMPDFVPMHPTEQPSQDAQALDWLETMTVNVRTPLRYGSHDLFWATPEERDGEAPGPSDIRTKIDAARAGQGQGGAA